MIMKIKKIKSIFLLMAISFILISTNLPRNNNLEIQSDNNGNLNIFNYPDAAVNHAPISIKDNYGLKRFVSREGLNGNGAYDSPYIIEGLTIDASKAHGIKIVDSDAYIIIRNCTIDGKSSSSYNGIILSDSSNVNIRNNTLINNVDGIVLMRSHNNTLFGNNAYNNENGICLANSDNNVLYENHINYNNYGIVLYIPIENNLIYLNYIYGNLYEQAIISRKYEDNQGFYCINQWNDNTTGNYWGNDYVAKYPNAKNNGIIWDTPYKIYGNYDEIDYIPLVNSTFPDFEAPLILNNSHEIKNIMGYSDLKISWTAGDLHPATYTIELNGFEMVSTTTLTNGVAIVYDIPDGLTGGDYNFTIIIEDENGNTAQDTVIFIVNRIYPIIIVSIVIISVVSIYVKKKYFGLTNAKNYI